MIFWWNMAPANALESYFGKAKGHCPPFYVSEGTEA